MKKQNNHTILDCKLIKVEKLYNQSERQKYYYNLHLEGIDDLLLVESNEIINANIIGCKIKYKLNEANEVSEFEFI